MSITEIKPFINHRKANFEIWILKMGEGDFRDRGRKDREMGPGEIGHVTAHRTLWPWENVKNSTISPRRLVLIHGSVKSHFQPSISDISEVVTRKFQRKSLKKIGRGTIFIFLILFKEILMPRICGYTLRLQSK